MTKKKEDVPGYAVKATGEFRAVGDKSWCADDETFTTQQPEVLEPAIDVEALRLVAYANPVTGSDRYLSEAASVVAAGGSWEDEDVKLLQAKALEVKASIQAQYPYPES